MSAYRLVKEKFRTTFEALESSDNIRKENLLKEFDSYCRELIVLGFNSSSYDLNLVKPILIERLLNEIDFVIKKANTYLCIKTSTLRFLDIKHFLAPGFSYRKFLIAYGSELEKFHFPYEFVDSLEKLESDLPNHQAFYSSLTKSNITTEEYGLVQKTWLEKRWKSLREMLVYYNLLDCVPFIQAVKNLLIPYKQQNLDIFKRSFSVSGIAKLRMIQKIEKDSFFLFVSKKTFGFIQNFEKSTYRRTQYCFLSVCCSRRNPNKKPRNFEPGNNRKNSRSGRKFPLFTRHCSKQPDRVFLQIQRIRKLQTGLLLKIRIDVLSMVKLHATKRRELHSK